VPVDSIKTSLASSTDSTVSGSETVVDQVGVDCFTRVGPVVTAVPVDDRALAFARAKVRPYSGRVKAAHDRQALAKTSLVTFRPVLVWNPRANVPQTGAS